MKNKSKTIAVFDAVISSAPATENDLTGEPKDTSAYSRWNENFLDEPRFQWTEQVVPKKWIVYSRPYRWAYRYIYEHEDMSVLDSLYSEAGFEMYENRLPAGIRIKRSQRTVSNSTGKPNHFLYLNIEAEKHQASRFHMKQAATILLRHAVREARQVIARPHGGNHFIVVNPWRYSPA